MDASASAGSPRSRVRSQPQPALDPVWIEAAASSSHLCRRASPPSSLSPWCLSPAPRRAALPEQETNARRTAAALSMEIVAASCAVIRPTPGAGALRPDPQPRSPAGLVVRDHLQVPYPVTALLPLLVGDNERVLRLLAPSAWPPGVPCPSAPPRW